MAKSILFEPVKSPYLVDFDDAFKIRKAVTDEPDHPGKEANREALAAAVDRINKCQNALYANDKHSVLLVFQALDASGKDGTIRAVLTGVNPTGTQVYAYKQPNAEELDHDFMWRVYKNLPERGRIGVWNRSHYEEVLVVRVHPDYLPAQKLPRGEDDLPQLWEERFESINAFEKHWARNGTVVLKFFLNVSQKEQHKRFLDRVNDAANHWKFSATDLGESERWDDYMDAYQEALRATSKPWAPWYCIPADSKSYMRRVIAEIIADTMEQLDLSTPTPTEEQMADILEAKSKLEAEL